ncbi:hypothetical protein QYZ88_000825 [Lachnospiraceae bacterium C1.1]|nr:hypothetical protein [Lachnospiraceae bacterium C1.1]
MFKSFFEKLPLWGKLLLMSVELGIILYAVFVGTTTTVLYQGF